MKTKIKQTSEGFALMQFSNVTFTWHPVVEDGIRLVAPTVEELTRLIEETLTRTT